MIQKREEVLGMASRLFCKRGGCSVGKRLAKSDFGKIRILVAANEHHYPNDQEEALNVRRTRCI